MAPRFLRGVFYGETLLNVVAGALPFFSPATFLAQFTTAEVPPVVLEVTRWYGVLLFVFVLLEASALLRRRDDLLMMVLQAFLVGDLIQLAALPSFVRAGGNIGFSFYFTIVVTVILVIARVVWLVDYHRRTKPSRPHA